MAAYPSARSLRRRGTGVLRLIGHNRSLQASLRTAARGARHDNQPPLLVAHLRGDWAKSERSDMIASVSSRLSRSSVLTSTVASGNVSDMTRMMTDVRAHHKTSSENRARRGNAWTAARTAPRLAKGGSPAGCFGRTPPAGILPAGRRVRSAADWVPWRRRLLREPVHLSDPSGVLRRARADACRVRRSRDYRRRRRSARRLRGR